MVVSSSFHRYLSVWQWNTTTPPSPGITRMCCTSDRLSIPSIAGQQTAAPTRVTITCPTATFTRETTCTGSTRDSTSVDGARNVYTPKPPAGDLHIAPDEYEQQSRAKRSPLNPRKPTGLNVETLVVADRKMVEKHGKENITTYVLTVMNMVSSLFKDGTIGKDINIVVVSLLLLEQDPVGLSISHHADLSLNSFCQWQSGLIGKNGKRHDHAVLLTGLDICSWKNEPCDTLGFAPISGMCSKYRSCTINEDTGLGLAFTIAHESGHNFGMIHDGEGNVCKKAEGNIMSPTLAGNNGVFSWSACSRQYLNRFLRRLLE
ncbi:A disintegrin and metalloproteinase with thrombospondin motifs 18 [Acipenser ruthenus]|uniref:A disintegrin and metalloproteinase with thrombospondin motifs 18 n=1 Tax=Acipenser ruthenus TaxID=7906 RepID=A0A444TX83_ACIRT|nr:A disintegrin and metalloproteinase with thrombospondin motifs 18 [Acipenser ruthenus]